MKADHRLAGCLLVLATSFAFGPAGIVAQETRNPGQPPAAPNAEQHKDSDKETPVPPEKASATHHEMTLAGKTLRYTATAGTLIIRDEDDKPYGSIFYVAYA